VDEGSVAVIRQTYANRLFFIVSRGTGKNGKGRVYLADEPASGWRVRFLDQERKKCFSPKGQARLVVPTPEVLAHAEKSPAKDFGMRLEIGVADVPNLIERQRGEN
jgi:hypothetical protein